MSYWQMVKMGYQELVNAIIRPPRAEYDAGTHLGPASFRFCGQEIRRTDFVVRNGRDMAIQCSHWEPTERRADALPCVVYMHGNSSARVEAIPQLATCLSLGATVVAFDFTGSGQSDGDWVSLGFYERDDLAAVVAHLREHRNVSTIALWGRSMGAATALMHGERDPSIAAMVLDSPFAELQQLAEEMVEKGREQGITVPVFVVRLVIRFIRSSVQARANFDIKDLSPIRSADKCFIPALFVAGEGDDFIAPHHSQQIHDVYGGDKNIVIVDGDHNSPRPRFLFDSVAIFLQTYLQIPEDWASSQGAAHTGVPPWYANNSRIMQAISMGLDPELLGLGLGGDGEGMEDLGMTEERQQEVQAALFAMLGQQRQIQQQQRTTEGGGSGGGGDDDGSGGDEGGDDVDEDEDEDEDNGDEEDDETDNDAGADGAGGRHATGATNGEGAVQFPRYHAPESMSEEREEWACTVCTLNNPGSMYQCLACGEARPHHAVRTHNHEEEELELHQRLQQQQQAMREHAGIQSPGLPPPTSGGGGGGGGGGEQGPAPGNE